MKLLDEYEDAVLSYVLRCIHCYVVPAACYSLTFWLVTWVVWGVW